MMSGKRLYEGTWGTAISFPFRLYSDDDGNFQDIDGTDPDIFYDNDTKSETGSFVNGTDDITLVLISETDQYQSWKVVWVPSEENPIPDWGRVTWKIRLNEAGVLKKEIGPYYSNIVQY